MARSSDADQFDPNPGNNSAGVTETPTTPPPPPPAQADLALTKTADQTSVMFGQNVTFTFVIRNAGPAAATNVVVSDSFPPGLVFVSASTPSQGSYDPGSGAWSVGTLPNGGFAIIQVTVRRVATLAPCGQHRPGQRRRTRPGAVQQHLVVHGRRRRTRPRSSPSVSSSPLACGRGSLGPGTGEEAAYFVEGLYRSVLDREADAAGLAGHVAALRAGASRQALAEAFLSSAEHRGLQIDSFYRDFLGRSASSTQPPAG